MKKNVSRPVRHIVAYVVSFNRASGKKGGIALVQGDPHEFSLTAEAGPRFIIAGQSSPTFHESRRATRTPCPGDEVILRVLGTGDDQKVIAWGFHEFWRQAQKLIESRPKPQIKRHINHLTVFRVLRQNRVNGKIVGVGGAASAGIANKEEVAFTGTLQRMLAESRRDGLRTSAVDKFAPTYIASAKLGIIAYNRCQMQDHTGAWVNCSDPRSFPLDVVYQLVHVKGKHRKVLMQGTKLEIAWKYPRTTNDPLRKYVSSGGPEGYVEWFRQEPDGRAGQQISLETRKPVRGIPAKWTECGDPRPDETAAKKPVAVKAPAAAAPASTDAKPAASKKHLRTVVATSLDSLEAALVPAGVATQ